MNEQEERREMYSLWWLFMLRWALPGLIFMISWLVLCWVGYNTGNSYYLYLGWIPALLLGWLADRLGGRIVRARINRIELEEGDEMQG